MHNVTTNRNSRRIDRTTTLTRKRTRRMKYDVREVNWDDLTKELKA